MLSLRLANALVAASDAQSRFFRVLSSAGQINAEVCQEAQAAELAFEALQEAAEGEPIEPPIVRTRYPR